MSLDITKLSDLDEIVFGPFIGEFGWEIARWSGFVRWFKKTYPTKKIIISTRENRQDLYTEPDLGNKNILELFSIFGDYGEYIPNCYDCDNLPEKMYNQVLQPLKEKYPNAFLFEPKYYKSDKTLFEFSDMDFSYTPRRPNCGVIDALLEHGDGRVPIVIDARNRKEMSYRNWGVSRWKSLFDMLQNSDKYVVFVAGMRPSYYRATDDMKNFFNLEDYASPSIYTTTSGLLIEAIKASQLTIGAQTASIILSNLLGTQTLLWGANVKDYVTTENPLKTKSFGIQDHTYSVDPYSIFNYIRKLTKM